MNAYGVYEGTFHSYVCGCSFGPGLTALIDFFVREYLSESSSFQISWIGSVQVLFLGCSGILGGYAMDHGYLWVIFALFMPYVSNHTI